MIPRARNFSQTDSIAEQLILRALLWDLSCCTAEELDWKQSNIQGVSELQL